MKRPGALQPGSAEARLMRLATYASVSVAAILIVSKLVVWSLSGSVALLGSLIDSALDVIASLISLYAVREALVPPDREHRFGHGKAESLAALGQSVFVGGSALILLFEAGNRFLNPQALAHQGWAIGVMVFSLVLTVGLVTFQRHVARRTGSVAIKADSLHYLTDVLINGGVIAGLSAIALVGWTILDPLIAVAIAIYLLHTAAMIARGSIDTLMDREFGEGVRARIREIVLSHSEVRAMHDLRTRSSGLSSFIQFHLELDGDMTLRRAHEIADAVEAIVNAEFPEAEVLIHQDPAGIAEERPHFA